MKKKVGIGIAAIVVCAACAGVYWFSAGNKPYNYDLDKYVAVGQYEGLEYDEPEKITVSESEIKDAIAEDLKKAETLTDVSDGEVHKGNTVNIDYVGVVDGKEFDGGSAESQEITVGSSGYIDGFDDGLIGKKVGDTVELNLKFPESYTKAELAGKDVVFTVKINSAKEKSVPECDEDFVKNNTSYDSVEAYKAAKKKEVYKQKEDEQLTALKQSLWQQVLDASQIKEYPDKEINKYVESGIKSAKDYADEYDMDYEDLVKSSLKMSVSDYEKQLADEARSSVKEQLVLYDIARQEGLEISNSEYKEKFKALAKSYGTDEESLEKNFESQYGKDYKQSLRESFLWDDVMNLIYNKAKVKS